MGGSESWPSWIPISQLKAAALVAALLFLAVVAWRRSRLDPKRTADRADRAAMYRQWGRRCAFRRLTWHRFMGCKGPLQAGHRRAHSDGGRTTPSNLMPICRRHNSDQRTMSEWSYAARRTIPVVGLFVFAARAMRAAMRR